VSNQSVPSDGDASDMTISYDLTHCADPLRLSRRKTGNTSNSRLIMIRKLEGGQDGMGLPKLPSIPPPSPPKMSPVAEKVTTFGGDPDETYHDDGELYEYIGEVGG
jgi:hypothetical protein